MPMGQVMWNGDILLVSVRINVILPTSAMVGVMCYSSRNLTDWKNEGVALSVDNDSSDIARGCILERPKSDI